MPQPKGQTGNPAGKPKGAINKRSADFRKQMDLACKELRYDLVKSVVRQAAGLDQRIMKGLTPSERARLVDNGRRMLLDFGYPRLKAVEVTNQEPVTIVIRDESK